MSSSSAQTAATVLESRVPLSRSLIWESQKKFYARRGIKAWTEDRVPEFITNNPFIADAYADLVFAFLQDCQAPGVSSPPLRIVELGSGTGKFAYLFLLRLRELLAQHDLSLTRIRYRMTDCSEELLHLWAANPYLQQFVQLGVLESSQSDGSHSPASADGAPLVVIANYVFDSFPQDAFVVRNRQLFELLVTTSANDAAGEIPPLSELRRSYEMVPVSMPRYQDPAWNQVLAGYCDRLSEAEILFPVQALATLSDLELLSDGRMLLLVGDKGFAQESSFPRGSGEPVFQFHAPDCFSQFVNFNVIARFYEATGGRALLPEKEHSQFHIAAFLRAPQRERCQATRKAYRDLQTAFGIDDLFSLMSWLDRHIEEAAVPQLLAVLRLSHWDQTTFLRLFPVLLRQAPSAIAAREDIRSAVSNVWARYFPATVLETSLAYCCGILLLELQFFDEALRFLEISVKEAGESAPIRYNMAVCHERLGRRSEALACLQEALRLDPVFEPASSALKKMKND